MRAITNKIRIYNHANLAEVIELKANKLGRPWHRVPQIFNNRFDLLDAHISIYFLKKFRVNIALKKMTFEMDSTQKYSQVMSTRLGHIAFQIERELLLNILHDFYGLARECQETPQLHNTPVTKTEERLRSKLAMEMAELILNGNVFADALEIKTDPASLISHWSYRVTFALEGDQEGHFSLLLDGAHVDALLASLGHQGHEHLAQQLDTFAPKRLENMVSTLPVKLIGRLAQVSLTVADLAKLKPGDILPIALPERFPLLVGQQPLFTAVIAEDRSKLYFSEFTDRNHEHYE
ncbi:flagellar motor switch protein FliM [Paramixta manurensis]|uniref:Flagellar motor switch protein FliM n=1 Tax=Paramixta manurensis TaxID=2740817 RepID=A0A6M8UAX9_9GAMM|nr:flagellar motor switch protein FliM [Erwiniaceae bacterium PD-1]